MDEEYIVLDIETTGLSKYIHKITEIAAVKMRGSKVVDEFQTLVNPEEHIPSFITRLTGIDDHMVKDAPCIEEVIPKFLEFMKNTTMVAHNATFDYGFLSYNIEKHAKKKFSNSRICTRRLANRLLPDLPSKKLGHLCQHLKIKNEQAHRAMSDVKATVELFTKMQKLLKLADINTEQDILQYQHSRIIRRGEPHEYLESGRYPQARRF